MLRAAVGLFSGPGIRETLLLTLSRLWEPEGTHPTPFWLRLRHPLDQEEGSHHGEPVTQTTSMFLPEPRVDPVSHV